MLRNKKMIVSTIINYIVFVCVAVCFFSTIFKDYKSDTGRVMPGWTLLRYFTVQSNLIMAAVSLVFAVYNTLKLFGASFEIPKALIVIKHVATVGVAVTFITVACYLSPINKAGYFKLFEGANFFYHFLVPVLAVLSLILFDGAKMPFTFTLFGLIPLIIYGVFYITNAFTHMQNGVITADYDWYYLLQGGTLMCVISMTVMTAMTFFVSAVLRQAAIAIAAQ